MNKKYAPWFWFSGGFALGFTLITVGHAALPKKAVEPAQAKPVSSLSELRTQKVGTPEMEQDYSKLTNLESRFAESETQQQKIKSATLRGTKGVRR